MVHMLEIWTKARFPLIIGVGILCVVGLVFFERFRGGIQKHQSHDQSEAALQPRSPQNHTAQNENADAISAELERVIDEQRKMIRETMDGYEYPRGKYNTNVEKLEDLLISEDGRPIQSVILTTWRSGSTFFGQVIGAHPAMFYHFEPLVDFGIVQVRGPPFAAAALQRVKALLACDYTDMEEYIEYSRNTSWVFEHNQYLWKECEVHREMCYNTTFLSEMCKLFPFQSMKLVRLRSRVAQHLLEDENLNIRMVLLVRDPRGIMGSRKYQDWCENQPDCWDPALLCADLSSDYKIAKELLEDFPTRFRVIRYEDLSAAPYERVEELTQFFGLNFHTNMKQFLDTHTKRNVGDEWTTFRDSKTTANRWKIKMTFEEVDEIQRHCLPAMKQWGYLQAMNATHQKTFDPVKNYTLNSVETVVPRNPN